MLRRHLAQHAWKNATSDVLEGRHPAREGGQPTDSPTDVDLRSLALYRAAYIGDDSALREAARKLALSW